jgi:hypothetical protein
MGKMWLVRNVNGNVKHSDLQSVRAIDTVKILVPMSVPTVEIEEFDSNLFEIYLKSATLPYNE